MFNCSQKDCNNFRSGSPPTVTTLFFNLISKDGNKDSLLGNINRLSIQFFNSWGEPITLNTTKILYENNQILNTDIININLINLEDITNDIKIRNWIIQKMTEIIKCFVIINFNINKKIPFYNTDNCINNKPETVVHYPKYYNLKLNNSDFIIDNIYDELNDFVTLNGFISSLKKNKFNKKSYITIDDYIKNIIWYNLSNQETNNILFNLETKGSI